MIKEARLQAGLTQKELAERLGITESAVGKMENKKSAPSVNTLQRVATAVGKELLVVFK